MRKNHNKGFWITFTKDKPKSGKFSTVDFGHGTSTSSGSLGTVDTGPGSQIDTGNMNQSDNAWVHADAHTGLANQSEVENELANTGSHELGHLLGLTHEDGDSTTLMDGDKDGKDKGFSKKAKDKLAKAAGLEGVCKHIVVKELDKASTGANSDDQSASMIFTPWGGIFGLGELLIQGAIDDIPGDGITFLESGTVKTSQGYSGEAYGFHDPLANYVIVLPDHLSVTHHDPNGKPVFEPLVVRFIDLEVVPGMEILSAELSGLSFSSTASRVDFEGTAGSANDYDDTTEEATADETEWIAGLIGQAQVTVNPGLLGFGTFLDDLQAALETGDQMTEFVLSSPLSEVTGGFEQPGETEDNRATLRAVHYGEMRDEPDERPFTRR